ncbi:hypothetical protein ABZ729_26920 [Streptomyces sp. NPDC006678]|uniref:hypothetical protein n=1 Tax=Streptomyces sp. NPDC006678 TaxID=3157185 RepID=UPI0033D2AA82
MEALTGQEEQYVFPVPPPGGWTADDLERMEVDVPYPIEIDLAAVDRRRGARD